MPVAHIMLDLETWGLTPGSDIRSIGACVFDPVGELVGKDLMAGGEFHLAVENPQLPPRTLLERAYAGQWTRYKYRLTRDPKTEEFWADQSDAAKSAFDIRVELRAGLEAFADWHAAVTDGMEGSTLWANGPHFDEAILAACYRAVDLPVPWHYRAPRDCRTIWDAAGGIDLPFEGTPHNALDDAKHQARCVIAAYRKLGQGAVA